MMNPLITSDVLYPESDGEPIGETDLHIDWILKLRDVFKRRYRDQQVYVASDLLLYYEEGVPRKYLVPDVFVVKNSDPGRRRVYKVWEEGQSPHFVLEVTSASTRKEGETYKPHRYAAIGVGEYFLYDPSAEYLRPALQGHRLDGEEYVRIEPDDSGRLYSGELDLHLRLEGSELQLYDGQTGERLLSSVEAAEEQEKGNERLRDLLRRHGIEE